MPLNRLFIKTLLLCTLIVFASCGTVTATKNDAVSATDESAAIDEGAAIDQGTTNDEGSPTECSEDSDCISVDPCLMGVCEEGSCAYKTGPINSCDDGDSCTENDICDGEGGCAGTPIECDDGDICNGSQTCFEGECIDVEGDIVVDGDECQSTGFCFAQRCQNLQATPHGTDCGPSNDNGKTYKNIEIGGVSWANSAFLVGINYADTSSSKSIPEKNICRRTPDGAWQTTGGPWPTPTIFSIRAMSKNLAVGIGGSVGFYSNNEVNWDSALGAAAAGNNDPLDITYKAVSRAPAPGLGGGWAWFAGTRNTGNGEFSYSKLCAPLEQGGWNCNDLNIQASFTSDLQAVALIECDDLEKNSCSLGLQGHWVAYQNPQGSYIAYGDAGIGAQITERHYIPVGAVNSMVTGVNEDVWVMGTDGLALHCSGSGADAACTELSNFAGSPVSFLDAWDYEGGTLLLARNQNGSKSNMLYLLPAGADKTDPASYLSFILSTQGVEDLNNVMARHLNVDPNTGSILIVGHGTSGSLETSDSVVLWSTP